MAEYEFHKLNSFHVYILEKVEKRPRSNQYFTRCYEVCRMLKTLEYLELVLEEKGNPFSGRYILSDKGKAFLKRHRKRQKLPK